MYDISYFKANKEEDVLAFMQANLFVTLCGVDVAGKPVATHVPVILKEMHGHLYLYAHVMRKQQHTIAFENNAAVLAIFLGPHSYISATNYAQQNTASTWNYTAVHASGTIEFLADEQLKHLLQELTQQYETIASPAAFHNIDEQYILTHMKAIVGFRIKVTNLQHVFKMSQNKSKAEQEKVIESLQNSSPAVAAFIQNINA